jgi:hypothetical protein
MKKVVVWGHKLGAHTHSYVHFGYWRASEYLGYQVEWFDDNDDVSGVVVGDDNVHAVAQRRKTEVSQELFF